MPLTLAEYADALDERDLIWPAVPAPIAMKARPSIAPLEGVRAVVWDLYGTLLRTTDGAFTLFPQQEIRLQVALEKTIHEFNMWQSMYRKPGPPWQSMINQYRDYAERLAMVATKLRGDFTDVNLVHVWRAIVDRLFDKEYVYDEDVMGDPTQLSEKIAYFFHANLQATEVRADALQTIRQLSEAGVIQGLLGDGQSFTMVQLTRGLLDQGLDVPIFKYLPSNRNVLSYQMGIRKPSKSLFEQLIAQFEDIGIDSDEILHVSCRLKTDLAPAKAVGMKTALLAS